MLINNPWGECNEKGLQAAARPIQSVEIVGVEKFENNDVDMVPQLTRLKDAGADSIILVGNARARRAGDEVARAHGLDRAGRSRTGASRGGRFRRAGRADRGRACISCRPTASSASRARWASACWRRCKTKYPAIKGPEDVIAPVGTANAYDAMHTRRARHRSRRDRPTAEAIRDGAAKI